MICIPPNRMSYDDHKFAKIKRGTKCDELQIKFKHSYIHKYFYLHFRKLNSSNVYRFGKIIKCLNNNYNIMLFLLQRYDCKRLLDIIIVCVK